MPITVNLDAVTITSGAPEGDNILAGTLLSAVQIGVNVSEFPLGDTSGLILSPAYIQVKPYRLTYFENKECELFNIVGKIRSRGWADDSPAISVSCSMFTAVNSIRNQGPPNNLKRTTLSTVRIRSSVNKGLVDIPVIVPDTTDYSYPGYGNDLGGAESSSWDGDIDVPGTDPGDYNDTGWSDSFSE